MDCFCAPVTTTYNDATQQQGLWWSIWCRYQSYPHGKKGANEVRYIINQYHQCLSKILSTRCAYDAYLSYQVRRAPSF